MHGSIRTYDRPKRIGTKRRLTSGQRDLNLMIVNVRKEKRRNNILPVLLFYLI